MRLSIHSLRNAAVHLLICAAWITLLALLSLAVLKPAKPIGTALGWLACAGMTLVMLGCLVEAWANWRIKGTKQ